MASIPDDPQWTAHLRGVGMFLGLIATFAALYALPREAYGSIITAYGIFAAGDVGQRITSKKDKPEKKPEAAPV